MSNLEPRSHNFDPSDPGDFHATGSVFHVGNPAESLDVYRGPMGEDDGYERVFVWQNSEMDQAMAEIAGWGTLYTGEEEGYGYLSIPKGTRPARSVLGGMQAWSGEKIELLSFIRQYVKSTKETFEGVDVSLSLDTVARTKNNDFFVVPPHDLAKEPEEMHDWLRGLIEDLEAVLANDERREILVAEFNKALLESMQG